MNSNQKRIAILSRVKEANLETKDRFSILWFLFVVILVLLIVLPICIGVYAFFEQRLYPKLELESISLILLCICLVVLLVFSSSSPSYSFISISVSRFYKSKEKEFSHFETEESSINYLIEMLDSPNSLLRKKAIEKIVKFNGRTEQAILKLAEISGEENSEMAKVAKEALEKISKTKRTNTIP